MLGGKSLVQHTASQINKTLSVTFPLIFGGAIFQGFNFLALAVKVLEFLKDFGVTTFS